MTHITSIRFPYAYLDNSTHNQTKEAGRVKGEPGKIVCETISQLTPVPESGDTIQRILETAQRVREKIFMSR